MKKLIDIRQMMNARRAGVENCSKMTNQQAVKAMKKTSSFTNERVWTNKI